MSVSMKQSTLDNLIWWSIIQKTWIMTLYNKHKSTTVPLPWALYITGKLPRSGGVTSGRLWGSQEPPNPQTQDPANPKKNRQYESIQRITDESIQMRSWSLLGCLLFCSATAIPQLAFFYSKKRLQRNFGAGRKSFPTNASSSHRRLQLTVNSCIPVARARRGKQDHASRLHP